MIHQSGVEFPTLHLTWTIRYTWWVTTDREVPTSVIMDLGPGPRGW